MASTANICFGAGFRIGINPSASRGSLRSLRSALGLRLESIGAPYEPLGLRLESIRTRREARCARLARRWLRLKLESIGAPRQDHCTPLAKLRLKLESIGAPREARFARSWMRVESIRSPREAPRLRLESIGARRWQQDCNPSGRPL